MGVHDIEVDPVGAGRLSPPDRVGQVGQVGVEDARRDPGPTAGHRYSPTPAGDRFVAALAEQGRRALGHEPCAPSGDGGRRRLTGPLRGELAARRADLLAAVPADRGLDAGRPKRRREALDDGHRAGHPRACARPGSSGSG